MKEQQKKFESLIRDLQAGENVAVAFSGGVDSSFLLKAAKTALGDKAVAITLDSDFFPEREKSEAADMCRKEGIRQIVIKVCFRDIERFPDNPPDRCYYCKRHMFSLIKGKAVEEGFPRVMEGSNVDDKGDYRPGERALAELEIESPLRKAGLTKDDIRALSRDMGLDTWSKPSFACLASRFEYDLPITAEKLRMVEKAEDFLMKAGFEQVRVRVHGDKARIEVLPEDIYRLSEDNMREKTTEYLTRLGFSSVAIDPRGYRMGSMNESLK